METINFRPHHLLACSLLLAGCDPTEDDYADVDDVVEPTPTGEITANQAEQVPVASGPIVDCPAARMIGVLNNATDSCSLREHLPPGWIWTGMFKNGSPGVGALTVPVPTDLKRFCMFNYVNGKPGPEQFNQLFNAIMASGTMTLDSVASDCRGEFAQYDLNDPSLAYELHDAFRDNIDWIDAAELGPTQAYRTPIDITVVDTVSQAAVDIPVDPENEHGLQMAALIADISCPDADPHCLDEIRHTLAMPRLDWSTPPEWVKGGGHGTQGDLALALYEAVGSWEQRRITTPADWSPRLVLNLSLGWQRLTEDTNDLERGPSKSLISALQYASCKGVLVFVAAGNNPDEGCPDEHMGPLAPAAFEEMAAPTEAECIALGFSSGPSSLPVFGGPGDYMPLVYAVGGVDEHDLPLINTRTKGRPRLAALGSNGLVAGAGGSTEPLTGTSVSAAVVSATAALVWSYLPKLRPHEVVDIIYNSGLDLGEKADFELTGTGPWTINRTSVCAALERACDGQDPDECPTKLECKLVASPDNMEHFFQQVDFLVNDGSTKVDELDAGSDGEVPVCESFDWTELADPQPEMPICSRCNLTVPAGSVLNDDKLLMTTDPAYDGLVVAASLLTVDGAGMPTNYTLSGAVITSLNNPITNVTTVYLNAPTAVSATLNVWLIDGTTQSNSIPVKLPAL